MPVKPLARVSAAREPLSAGGRRKCDGQVHGVVGEAGDARRRLSVALGVLLREIAPAARVGARIPGADSPASRPALG